MPSRVNRNQFRRLGLCLWLRNLGTGITEILLLLQLENGLLTKKDKKLPFTGHVVCTM
jgi:hypothetical protein